MGFDAEFSGFLDSTVKVGRRSLDRTDADASYPAQTMAVVATGAKASIQENRGGLDRRPGGKLERATHDAFMAPTHDVAVADVVQPTAGPEAGRYFVVRAAWKVLADHWEMVLEESEEEKAWAADNAW